MVRTLFSPWGARCDSFVYPSNQLQIRERKREVQLATPPKLRANPQRQPPGAQKAEPVEPRGPGRKSEDSTGGRA